MHPAGHASARPRRERVRLGVFEVVGHLVQERVEQLFQGPQPLLAVAHVDAHQAARLVVAAEHAGRGPAVDIQVVIDAAPVDSLEAVPEERAEGRERRDEASRRRRVRGPRDLAVGPRPRARPRPGDRQIVVTSLPAPILGMLRRFIHRSLRCLERREDRTRPPGGEPRGRPRRQQSTVINTSPGHR